ncbi:hypothetical protein HispidOSU_022114 [Sigmodon hispidus]
MLRNCQRSSNQSMLMIMGLQLKCRYYQAGLAGSPDSVVSPASPPPPPLCPERKTKSIYTPFANAFSMNSKSLKAPTQSYSPLISPYLFKFSLSISDSKQLPGSCFFQSTAAALA